MKPKSFCEWEVKKMDNKYLNELIERLNGTEIWRGIDERCSDYHVVEEQAGDIRTG